MAPSVSQPKFKTFEEKQSTFKPEINKKSAAMAKKRPIKKDTDPRTSAQKIAEARAEQKHKDQERQVRKVSDRYILQRFRREFDNIAGKVCLDTPEDEDDEDYEPQPITPEIRVNYLRFKEFLINMGLLTEEQASFECLENALVNEAWLITPKSEENDEEFVTLGDLRVLVMAVLRLNDGQHYVEG